VQAQTEQKQLRIIDCGLADYKQILDLQLKLCEQRRTGQISDTVLIVEHYPVITLGAHKTANRLCVSHEQIRTKGIDIVEIRRGGGATAHNPGQVVIYPILNLFELRLGVREYIARLEQIGKSTLEQIGVISESRNGLPGLWVGGKKIASIGVHVREGVTSHGIAININNDLSIFDLFIPCGLDGVKMTSVFNETGQRHPMIEVKQKLYPLLIKSLSNEYDECKTWL